MMWMIYICAVVLLAILGLVNDYHPKIQKLIELKNSLSFKIEYLSRFEDDYYYLTLKNIVKIPRYNKAVHDEEEYLYSVAHEIGHVIFERIEEEKEVIGKNFKGYKQITRERRAWDIAEMILEEKGMLKDKTKFYKLRNKCLSDYRKVYSKRKIFKKRANRYTKEQKRI